MGDTLPYIVSKDERTPIICIQYPMFLMSIIEYAIREKKTLSDALESLMIADDEVLLTLNDKYPYCVYRKKEMLPECWWVVPMFDDAFTSYVNQSTKKGFAVKREMIIYINALLQHVQNSIKEEDRKALKKFYDQTLTIAVFMNDYERMKQIIGDSMTLEVSCGIVFGLKRMGAYLSSKLISLTTDFHMILEEEDEDFTKNDCGNLLENIKYLKIWYYLIQDNPQFEKAKDGSDNYICADWLVYGRNRIMTMKGEIMRNVIDEIISLLPETLKTKILCFAGLAAPANNLATADEVRELRREIREALPGWKNSFEAYSKTKTARGIIRDLEGKEDTLTSSEKQVLEVAKDCLDTE